MNESLGLYLHVPFCKAKCHYCDFYSGCNLDLIPEYEKALMRAILSGREHLLSYTVDTVYLGGGTPSLLSCEGLVSIFDALNHACRLSPEAEITMEMNPESTTKSLLQQAKRVGVNRISFGMQSAKDEELCSIGRLHCHAQTEKAVKWAKEAGIDNISLDLMYGLPGQTLRSFRESLKACVSLDPKHISFYLLTLSPKAPLYKKRHTLPGDDEVREMYLFAHDFLEQEGFSHYEISNAARPGFHSRHNLKYWQGEEYLGIGPGAHSFFGGDRFFMAEETESFILASNLFDTVREKQKMEAEDYRTEYVMLSLRRKEGIDFERLLALSDEVFCKRAREKFSLWSRHGLCHQTEKGFALTPEGFFVSNQMISDLI